ncbi:MAG: VTT domain-containing protein [Deltaproteobacteria bacterium]|nr:VTT domain-containing protein [Deltaproteobacteria bacterium]
MNELIEILIRYGYSLLFMGVLAEQLGLPLPAGLFMLSAGALSGLGHFSVAVSFVLALLACLLGDQFWYQVGFRRGGSVLPWLCRISFNPETCVRRTQNIFYRHGAKALLIVKFFPGVNAIAAPLSGILKMPFLRFLLFDSLGACIWIGSFTGFGYILSHQIERAGDYTELIGSIFWGGIFGIFFLTILWKYVGRQRFLKQFRSARISPEELKQKIETDQELLILDVRNILELEADPQIIPGALVLPLEKLEMDPPDLPLPKGREVILYCDCPNEASSVRAAMLLKKRGIPEVKPLAGGFRAWKDKDYPLESRIL